MESKFKILFDLCAFSNYKADPERGIPENVLDLSPYVQKVYNYYMAAYL